MTTFEVTPFDGQRHTEALTALFDAASSPCFCRYWHFAGDKNDWLARCSSAPDESRAELERAAKAGSDEARGVVAWLGERLVGFMKVAPKAALPKLYEQRYYRGLAALGGDPSGVFVVGCALVHPAHRGQGVAHALARGAVDAARAWGGHVLEALPRVVDSRVSDEEMWMGPLGAFEAAGFVCVHEARSYPVLRRDLGGPDPGA